MPDLSTLAREWAADSDLRDQLVDTWQTSRRAVLKPAPKATRLRRAGDAVQSVGAVVTRAGAKAEAQRRAERRSRRLRAVLLGGAAAAVAAVATRTRQSSPNPTGGTDV